MECDASIYVESWYCTCAFANNRCRLPLPQEVCCSLLLPKISKVCNVPRQRRWRRLQVKVGSTCWPQRTTHQRLFLNGILIYLVHGPTLGLISAAARSLSRWCLVNAVIRLGIYASRRLGVLQHELARLITVSTNTVVPMPPGVG